MKHDLHPRRNMDEPITKLNKVLYLVGLRWDLHQLGSNASGHRLQHSSQRGNCSAGTFNR